MLATSRRRERDTTMYLVVGGLIALFVVFFGGYRYGGRNEHSRVFAISADTNHREQRLREDMAQCGRDVEALTAKTAQTADVTALKAEIGALRTRNDDLFSRHQRYVKESAECSEVADRARRQWTEEDGETAQKIEAATKELADLRRTLDVLTDGRGARTALTLQALAAMRGLHRHLMLGLRTFRGDDPSMLPTIEAELLTKWAAVIDNETDQRVGARKADVATYTAAWKKYTPGTGAILFVEKRNDDGTYVRPTWGGKTMAVNGVDVLQKALALPPLSLSATMIDMYQTLLCASRSKNPYLTHPSTLLWEGSQRTQLSDILDVPLITMCLGCPLLTGSRLYSIACGADGGLRAYGSATFWQVRSLLRFTSAIYELADQFMEENGLVAGEYAAAVSHALHRERCASGAEGIAYRPHRLWIAQNFGPAAARHVNSDRELQCAPGDDDIVKGTTIFPATGLTKVYVSIADSMPSDKLQSHNIKVYHRHVKTAVDEAVDLVIASRARNIAVSAFYEPSQVVTELFLLRNNFDYTKIRFF